jgi:catechol 2,3-dioxygenase-like lactoylglutathione lyase family enzyme
MPARSALHPTSLDHVALWVTEREALTQLACDRLGMHVIDATDRFTLVGSDARRGKLTLFDAEGPREVGALARVALRVRDLAAARAALGTDLAVEEEPGGVLAFDAPDGLRIGLVEDPAAEVDYDLDHVLLRVSDVPATVAAWQELGFDAAGDALVVAGKEIRLVAGGAAEGERPLLNHIAVLVESAGAVEDEARRRGADIADVVDAKNTLAVFVWTPDRIKIEYVEHKPTFSLV